MTDLETQLRAFALAHGGALRYGPQPERPPVDKPASIGRPQPVQRPAPADPWIDYTDDYSLWCRTRRGE